MSIYSFVGALLYQMDIISNEDITNPDNQDSYLHNVNDIVQACKGILYFILLFSDSQFRRVIIERLVKMYKKRTIFIKHDKKEKLENI